MFINIEAGYYNKINLGEIDGIFDKTTRNPGEARLEKMVAGKYIGNIFFS